MVKHREALMISVEILAKRLDLPKDVEIIDAEMDNFASSGIKLLLSGPSLKECPEGSYPLLRYIKI